MQLLWPILAFILSCQRASADGGIELTKEPAVIEVQQRMIEIVELNDTHRHIQIVTPSHIIDCPSISSQRLIHNKSARTLTLTLDNPVEQCKREETINA